MQVAIVFSSGELLYTLQVPISSRLNQLRSTLQTRIPNELLAYINANPQPNELPLALKLRNSPGDSPVQVYNDVRLRQVRLLTCAGEISDYQATIKAPSTFCLLRPRDIVISSYNLQGKEGKVVLNTEEEVAWGESLTSSEEREIKLVIYSIQQGFFLCSARIPDTVQSLKTRLAAITGKADIRLWQNCDLLQDKCTLQACSMHNLSHISVQVNTNLLAVVSDSRGTSALFPVTIDCKVSEIQQLASKLQRAWILASVCHEFICLFPSIPHIYKRFIVQLPEDRILTLTLKHKNTLVSVFPHLLSIGQIKAFIESQHGLPAALIALQAVGELKPWSSFSTYGVEEGDQLMLLRRLVKVGKLTISVIRKGEAKIKVALPQSASIADLKRNILNLDPAMGTNLLIMRGTEILLDELTLEQYGIVTNLTVFCGNIGEMQRILWKNGFMPPRISTSYIESEDALELFDIGQDLNKIPSSERYERYQEELKQTLSVRIITCTSVLALNVHIDCTVQVLKVNLRSRVRAKSFKLLWRGAELEEQRTLLEQGVEAGDLLLLISPGCMRITVLLPSGQTWPVVVQREGTVNALKYVVEQLTGLQEQGQRLLFAKDLPRDSQLLPESVDTLVVSLKLGSGREYSLATPSGLVLRVQANSSATAGEVQEQLTQRGVPGTLFQS